MENGKTSKKKTGGDNAIKQIIYIRRNQTRTEEKAVQGDRNKNRNRIIIPLPTVQEIFTRAKEIQRRFRI